MLDRLLRLRLGLRDRAVPVFLGDGDAGLGFLADPVELGGGLGQLLAGLANAGLLGGQLRGHVLRRGVGVGAPLVSLAGALLGCGCPGLGGSGLLPGRGPYRLDLRLGRGRVGGCRDGLAEPFGDSGNLVSFRAQRPQQVGAGQPGHGDGCLGLSVASDRTALGVGQALALPPGG